MDLNKIATEGTYLQKVAALVDGFASGEISGEQADEIAVELGISPEDLKQDFMVRYGDELGKQASEYDDGEMTYLQKVATIVDSYAAGEINGDEAYIIAEENGIPSHDVDAVFDEAYGQELQKIAAVEVLDEVAEFGTPLQKIAAVTDAYLSDALSDEETVQVCDHLGIDSQDIIFSLNKVAAEAEKEAEKEGKKEAEKEGKKISELISEYSGWKGVKKAHEAGEGKLKAYANLGGRVGGAAIGAGALGYGAYKLNEHLKKKDNLNKTSAEEEKKKKKIGELISEYSGWKGAKEAFNAKSGRKAAYANFAGRTLGAAGATAGVAYGVHHYMKGKKEQASRDSKPLEYPQ